MEVNFVGDCIVISGQSDEERAAIAKSSTAREGLMYSCVHTVAGTITLQVADKLPTGARQPINITYDTTPMPLQLISNLAATPFVLDGRGYASIEGFWQGLKFAAEAERRRIAALSGHAAKDAGPSSTPGDRIAYDGREICVGTADHWALMERACQAKFSQHDGARAALQSTGTRPLEHKVKVDSRTIPGVIMADIWMRLRSQLAQSRGQTLRV